MTSQCHKAEYLLTRFVVWRQSPAYGLERVWLDLGASLVQCRLWCSCLKVVKVEKEVWVGCKSANSSLDLDSLIVQVSYVCGAAAEEQVVQVVQVEQDGQVESQT